MTKRICFAGFGGEELEDLQPALAALGGVWDCNFSPDAKAALDALVAKPFDAVVVNLTPNGINNTELLQQAAIKHPRTLRLVLGAVADRELIVNCMGAAHQFISKPWKPAQLVSIIERSLALDAWLSTDKLRAFVPRLGKLPSLPATYFEVLKKAESPHSNVDSIAEVIARDPSLTARLLQMVNSPACGLSEIITSPNEAVTRLGLETVKSLVLCLQLFAKSEPAPGASFSLDQLWHHSFSAAKFAAKIAQQCMAGDRMASEAYTAGLLHNIGQIVLATNLSREYSAVVETARNRKCPLQEVELEQLGVTSNQVGAYLLGLWGMPLPLVEAAALYHAPGSGKSAEFTLLTVVHVANVLASEDEERVKGLPRPKLDTDYLVKLGLPKKTDAWRKLIANGAPNGTQTNSYAADRPLSPAPVHKTSVRPGKKFFLVAGFAAVIVIAVVMLQPKSGRVAPPADSPIASAPPPATPAADVTAPPAVAPPKAVEATGAPAGASPFNSVKIQSILYSTRHPMVIINGKSLEVKDRIDGLEVVSIARSSVVLACNGEQRTFDIK